jgi:hypothetical protein
VSVGVGVLSSEDPAHGVHSLKVPGNGHLLVQLGRLGQVRGALEVGHLQQEISVMLTAELDNIITNEEDPGSGAFLISGSGMGKKSRSGSGTNIQDHISKSLETVFWV